MTSTADAVAAFLATKGATKVATGARTMTEKQVYMATRDKEVIVVTDAEPLEWFADLHKLFGLANTATRFFQGVDENMFKASMCREGDRVAKMLCDAINTARKEWTEIKKCNDMARGIVALERIYLSLCYGRFLTAENIKAYEDLCKYFDRRPY